MLAVLHYIDDGHRIYLEISLHFGALSDQCGLTMSAHCSGAYKSTISNFFES